MKTQKGFRWLSILVSFAAITIFSSCSLTASSFPRVAASESGAGTSGGNPAFTVGFRIAENTVGTGSVSNLSLCLSRARFVPADSSLPPIQVILDTGNLTVSSSGNMLASVALRAQHYARVELDTSTSCAASSIVVTNGSGSYSSALPITLQFVSPFEVTAKSTTIQLNIDGYVQNLSSVTSNGAVKPSVDSTQGAVSVIDTIPPVGWWKLDDGSGGSALDSSPTGATGTLIGGPAWVAGKMGSALSFDGVASYVDLGNPSNLNFGVSSFSYSVWVFVTSSAGNWDMPFSKGGWMDVMNGYDMELGTGAWGATLSDGTTSKSAVFGNEMLSQWVFLSAVVDRSSNRFWAYTNGLPYDSVDITGFGSVSSPNPANIGNNGNSGNFFKGIVDDVRIYDRALTPAQVERLYEGTL